MPESISPTDVRNALPTIDQIQPGIAGGQKIVFPVDISGQRFALKVIPLPPETETSDADDERDSIDEITARAQREVDTLSQCESPYIVRLGPIPLSSGTMGEHRVLYFSEEWIDGKSVAELLREGGPFTVLDVARLGENIVRAIEVLWNLERVHRDIKPGNIMHSNSSANYVLLDMGIAFDLRAESLTISHAPIGTWRYFSPEQFDFARRRQMDFRSDLFSLGVVLYEASTGQHPFWSAGMTKPQVSQNILTVRPQRPSELRDMPSRLDASIMRLLSKQPHMRYGKLSDLIEDLRDIGGAN